MASFFSKVLEYWTIATEFMIDMSWILDGISSGFVMYVVGNLILYGYREHGYLYQFDDKKKGHCHVDQIFAPPSTDDPVSALPPMDQAKEESGRIHAGMGYL